jgi:hypothetical protein
VSQVVWTSPLAFLLGVGVGLLLSSRYRIIRLNGEKRKEQ